MQNVILMQGISGSGKSTVARKLVDGVPGAVIVSSDAYLVGPDGYQFSPDRLLAAHEACFRDYRQALSKACPLVLVDNTNTRVTYVRRYVSTAKDYGYQFLLLRVLCDVSVAASRNQHSVPLSTIEQQYRCLTDTLWPSEWPVEVYQSAS